MRLKIGELAPVFAQRDMYERTVSLPQYWGRKLLLSFYRGAVCPLCNLRLHYLIDHYEDFRRQGLEMIVFFESSPEMARRYLDRQRPPFPVIPDLRREVYSLYGLESSLFGAIKARLMRGSAYREAASRQIGGNFWKNLIEMDGAMGRKPADFLLSPDLRIQSAYYGHDAGDFMPFAEIDRFLMTRPESPWTDHRRAAVQSTRYPGAGYSDPRGPTSGRSYPDQGRSAPGGPGGYGNYPSGSSRPENWRPGGSGNSGNSGWDNPGW